MSRYIAICMSMYVYFSNIEKGQHTMTTCMCLVCQSTHVKAMQEEGGGSFWATFGGGTNGAEVRHVVG